MLEHLLGKEWQVIPAGGVTGEAYYAQYGEEKLFLKRNSSPFLAVLSAEGIVPKLLWTKRLENGDVITAQKWISGRELKSYEMNDKNVAHLLGKIHRSKELLEMFKRIGNLPLTPQAIFEDLTEKIAETLIDRSIIFESLSFLKNQLNEIENDEYVVCHSDLNHNNWIYSETKELYLIDWDGAIVADPALDLGLLLYLYIPIKDWETWLSNYGVPLTDELCKRMHWYVISQTIYEILWYKQRNLNNDIENSISYLNTLLHADISTT